MSDAARVILRRHAAAAAGAVTRRSVWLGGLGGLALAGSTTAAEGPIVPRADHHLHIQGPGISEALKRLGARDPSVIKFVDPAVLKTRSAADALAVLDTAGVRRGVLLSEAYMFGSPLMSPDNPDVAALTRAENAYNVAEAGKSGGRLVAFVGVDPLSPTAFPELDYWAGRGAAGLKLHLANSFFDFGDDAHMAQLQGVFAQAGRRRMPIAIHLRNRVPWGAAQVDAFVERVLPAAAGLPVQVAHGAGWGGFDQPTLAALEAFAAAIAAKKPGTASLSFDLSVVLALWTGPESPARYVAAMRRAGLERFLFASDWPAKYAPREQAAYLRGALPLSDDEWRAIFGREAGYLQRRRPA
jgi:predicted TIM-barrel fold metal-dependent hydrolase